MYPPRTGMDHLGLASVSQDRILPALSPAINVLTVHPRYWSFYCWLLTEFWDRELPRTQSAWGEFLKPRERIFVGAVLTCARHGDDIPQVGGKLKVGAELAAGATAIDPHAPYLKNARGGYPIYASAIAQMGLTIQEGDTKQFDCDAPTEVGRQLGRTFRDWVRSTRYYRDYFDVDQELVPLSVIKKYGERVCLCRVADGPDLQILQDAFLYGGREEEAAARRASLRLVCDLSNQTAKAAIDPWTFRQLVYYRHGDAGASYTPSNPDLLQTARRWRLYQHRELVAWALNRWLCNLSVSGLAAGGDHRAITQDDVLQLGSSVDFAALAAELNIGDPGLDADSPVDDLLDWVRREAEITGDLDDAWDITLPLCEEPLVNALWDLTRSGPAVTTGLLALLATCAARLWSKELQLRYANDWSLVSAGGWRRLSVMRFLDDIRSHSAAGRTVGETARWIAEHYVMRQHHRVALGKLPDDTFRLRLDGPQVWFALETVAVEMNDSRYRALSTCATELGWTDPLDIAGHKLTATGKQLLKKGGLASARSAANP
jgi:hypothetical protein